MVDNELFDVLFGSEGVDEALLFVIDCETDVIDLVWVEVVMDVALRVEMAVLYLNVDMIIDGEDSCEEDSLLIEEDVTIPYAW